MDSMRSLNTSLPSSTSYSQPPEQLLQAFKAAALSVTNLYKSAASDQAQAKQAGYQEAIEDLLHFLDRENLGLGDGEGWKVRQWATERAEGTPATFDSDDDDKQTRSSPPAVLRKEQRDKPQQDSSSSPQAESPTEPHASTNHEQSTALPTGDSSTLTRPSIFTFSAGPQFPSMSLDMDTQTPDHTPVSSASSVDTPGVGISVLPRNPWSANRHNNSTRRSSARDSGTSFGNKRKHHVPDFFDVSGLNGRDLFGGGKRGRFA
jgi:hypothetical protein